MKSSKEHIWNIRDKTTKMEWSELMLTEYEDHILCMNICTEACKCKWKIISMKVVAKNN
jgi:hypothetical protein